jgi:hypothetical protein
MKCLLGIGLCSAMYSANKDSCLQGCIDWITVLVLVTSEAQPLQSVACQARRRDAANTASEFSLVKLEMPSWRPFKAMLAWWNARLRVSDDCEIQARWEAEKARIECITNGLEAAMLRNLRLVSQRRPCERGVARNTHFGIMSAHKVILEVLFRNISFVMEERW